jgi:hypothetical protein
MGNHNFLYYYNFINWPLRLLKYSYLTENLVIKLKTEPVLVRNYVCRKLLASNCKTVFATTLEEPHIIVMNGGVARFAPRDFLPCRCGPVCAYC